MKNPRHIGQRLAAIIIVVASAVSFASAASAQASPYKFDLGAALGMSGYIGEANRANPFARPGFEGELAFRYLADTRWAVRGMLSTLSLSGTTEGMANVLPAQQNFTFRSQVYELSCRGEFNFLPYGIGETYKRLRRCTPYLTLGIGAALCSSGGHTAVAPVIPMGFGVKFKIRPRLNFGAEFTMTKAFNDRFDGPQLSDINQIKTAFYKSTDWYSRLTVGITYEFGERCETCHYVD